MVARKIELLKNTRAQVAKLERAIAIQLRRELASLPRKYGFASVQDFITAERNGAGNKIAGHKGRKRRVVITADIRAKVKGLVTAGKTGAQIARALNIFLPSVQNIKKEHGLVKRRR